MYKSVFVNDIHNQLMASVNPEISYIRMGSGPALFGLARFYYILKLCVASSVWKVSMSYLPTKALAIRWLHMPEIAVV